MAIDGGNASFTPGTGTKTIALGMTPTWMRITVKGSAFLPFQGFIYSGFQYCYPDNSTNLDTTKAIKIKNSAGTVVIEGTWTSFSSNNANFTLTTNSGTPPTMMLEFGN